MRREGIYLVDIIEACKAVSRFIAGLDEDAFRQSELHQSAVLQKLTVIGEAAARLSPGFRDAHPEVGWQDIVGFRNIAVHAYFSVDWSIVWATAVREVPALLAEISKILEADFPDLE